MWEDGAALHYRAQGPRLGAEQLLVLIGQQLGWQTVTYSEKSPLGLQGPVGKVSLEPGSQLEFSANPRASVGEAAHLVDEFETAVDAITGPKGLHWIGLGINPVSTVADIDVIPLTRYRIMTEYLAKQGSLGTTMMRLSSSIQINFDYANEKEAIEMLRVALAVAPLATALFGNSPISHGKPNGWLSFRSEVWRNTDKDRTGLVPEAFEDGFSFEKYAELAWKRPLMFVQNKRGENVESYRRNLHEVMMGQLEDCEFNEENELNALRQVFTEARIKPGYVEVRSIDGLRVEDRYAAVAFWTGLMYSHEGRARALDLLGTLSIPLREELWVSAGREGMRAHVRGLSMRAIGQELTETAKRALILRGHGEERFLKPLERGLHEGKNPADHVLELFQGPWKGSIAELIRYSAARST